MKALSYRFDASRLSEDGPCVSPEFLRQVLGEQAITVRQVNDLAAKQLLSAERSYWLAFHARAESDDDMRRACDELNKLDAMEGASRG